MFEQAKLKRQGLNTRLNNFFKFKEANATVSGGLLHTSAEKRKQIETNLNRWSNPYAQTGADQFKNHPDLSMSFRFSESNFKHAIEKPEENKDQSILRKQLQREFYENDQGRSDTPTKQQPEVGMPEQGSPVQQRYNPLEQDQSKNIGDSPERFPLSVLSPKSDINGDGKQSNPVLDPALIMNPDKLQTERSATPRIPSAQKQQQQDSERVQVNNNPSLGESVFNCLDLSASNRPESNPFAETIKPARVLQAAQELAVSRASEHHPVEPVAPNIQKTPQDSGVKSNPSGLNNNSSQGIFFTDDFKDFIDRKHADGSINTVSPKKPDIINQEAPEQTEQSPEKLPVVPAAPVQTVIQNPKESSMPPPVRESLFTDPNQQGQLRQSLTLSIFDRVFAEKIGTQLVVDLEDVTLHKFEKELARKRFLELTQRFVEVEQRRELIREIAQLSQVRRWVKLQRRVRQGVLYEHFLHIKLYRQYRQNKVRREIAMKHYRQLKLRRRVDQIFRVLKDITRARKNWLEQFRRQSEANALHMAMKHWKMYWFHRRIKREVKQFHMSSLFSGWKRAADKQREQDDRLALRFYFQKSLQRAFKLLVEGVDNSQRERYIQERAKSFCRQRQLRPVFEAWRDVAEQLADQKNNRDYIPIELTVKNRLTTGSQMLKTREVQINVLK